MENDMPIWDGIVYLKVNGEEQELCDARMTDFTQWVEHGMKLEFVMKRSIMEGLHFEQFHSVHDLETIMQACTKPTQLAALTSEDVALQKVANYMYFMNYVRLPTFV
jgi:hypothetical protein